MVAMIIPTRAIINILPNLVKSSFVVVPITAMTAKVPAVTKNAVAMVIAGQEMLFSLLKLCIR